MSAQWKKTKVVTVGNASVDVLCSGETDAQGMTRVVASAAVGEVTYSEPWLLPHDNPDYTQAQAQKDFETHCTKVARLAAARANSKNILPSLT